MNRFMIALAATFIVTGAAQAQSDTTYFDAQCANGDDLNSVMARYQEQPMLGAISVRGSDPVHVMVPVVLFMNPETRTWTLVEQHAEDHYCVIAAGRGIAPFVNEAPDIEKPKRRS